MVKGEGGGEPKRDFLSRNADYTKNMKSLLVFDCFGVLYDEIAPIVLRRYFGNELGESIKNEYMPRIDRGELSQEEAFEEWERRFGAPACEFKRAWAEQTHPRLANLERVKELSKTHDICLLSNAPTGMVERLFRLQGMEGYFQKIYSSSSLRMAKPEKEIYEYVEKDMGPNYSYTMIDDNPANLLVPQQLGWDTILFRSILDLEHL